MDACLVCWYFVRLPMGTDSVLDYAEHYAWTFFALELGQTLAPLCDLLEQRMLWVRVDCYYFLIHQLPCMSPIANC